MFNFWSPFFTVINHCVPIRPGCGAAVPSIWFSANWTFIGWFSQGANLCGNNRCSHNGRKCESFPFYPWCSLEYFSQKFLILLNFHPSSDFLPCQILPEETPMQEQESDSLLIENNPVVADIQTWRIEFSILKGSVRTVGRRIHEVIFQKME